MKKKIRVYLTVDLEVDEDLDVAGAIGVGKYEEYPSGQETIHLKTDDFEVVEYVDIEIKDR